MALSGYLILVLVSSLACSCERPTASEISLHPTPEPPFESKAESFEEVAPSDGNVAFEGVSFRYDPRVFGRVKQRVVPEYRLEEPDHKPDYVAPEHVHFEFELGREHGKTEIAVYPIELFPKVYSVDPSMVEGINQEIEGLRKVLKDKSYRLDGEIPHLPYVDASNTFYVKVRDIDFKNGDGLLFITHWMHGAELVSNRSLIYRFEGITSDGKFYVTAETPVKVRFLPHDSPDEFEGFTFKNLMEHYRGSKPAVEKYEKYIKSITTRLEKLGPNDFSPKLAQFESIISSLRINK